MYTATNTRLILLLIATVLCCTVAKATDPIEVKRLEIDGDSFSCVTYDDNGNLICAANAAYGGFFNSVSATAIRKILPDGTEFWTNRWMYDRFEQLTSVEADATGNMYFAGLTNHGNSGSDLEMRSLLLKYSPGGKFLWGKTWRYYHFFAKKDVCLTESGKLLIAGGVLDKNTKARKSVILCYNTEGELEWSKAVVSGNNRVHVTSIEDHGNQLYLGILTTADSDRFHSIVCLNENQEIQWQKTWQGNLVANNESLHIDSQGNIYSYCRPKENLNRLEFSTFIQKLAPDGTSIWHRFIDTEYRISHCRALIDTDDSFWLCGGVYDKDDSTAIPVGRGFVSVNISPNGNVARFDLFSSSVRTSVVRELLISPDGNLELISQDRFKNDNGWQPCQFTEVEGLLSEVNLEFEIVPITGSAESVEHRASTMEEIEEALEKQSVNI